MLNLKKFLKCTIHAAPDGETYGDQEEITKDCRVFVIDSETVFQLLGSRNDQQLYTEPEDVALPFDKIWIDFIDRGRPLKGVYIKEYSPIDFEIHALIWLKDSPDALVTKVRRSFKDVFDEYIAMAQQLLEKKKLDQEVSAYESIHFAVLIGIVEIFRIFAKNSEYSTAHELCDYTFITRKTNGKRKAQTINKLIHIYKKSNSKPHPVCGGKMDYTHRWLVRGHWRKCTLIGKNRAGNYEVQGYTWVVPHEKGEGDLVSDKIRVFHPESRLAHTSV